MLKTEIKRYRSDGLDMVGYYIVDEAHGGPRPGILVFPEAFGMSEHARKQARGYAELGYATLVCDIHGEERVLATLPEAGVFVGGMLKEPERIRARARDALDVLIAQPEVDRTRIGAIGYCFGGTLALELARSGAPIAAALGIHSTLSTLDPAKPGAIKGKVLVCIGAEDKGIDQAARADFETEMRDCGADWRMHIYGGVTHSFTNEDAAQYGVPDMLRFDASANRRSWRESVDLFEEAFA